MVWSKYDLNLFRTGVITLLMDSKNFLLGKGESGSLEVIWRMVWQFGKEKLCTSFKLFYELITLHLGKVFKVFKKWTNSIGIFFFFHKFFIFVLKISLMGFFLYEQKRKLTDWSIWVIVGTGQDNILN